MSYSALESVEISEYGFSAFRDQFEVINNSSLLLITIGIYIKVSFNFHLTSIFIRSVFLDFDDKYADPKSQINDLR